MLENLDGKQYDYLPHQDQYNARLSRLRSDLADEMMQLIYGYCDRSDEVTSEHLFGVRGFSERHRDMVGALGVEEEANMLIG